MYIRINNQPGGGVDISSFLGKSLKPTGIHRINIEEINDIWRCDPKAQGTQSPLNDLLMKYGDKSMAEDYINSGSKELHEGGAAWARANGYSIRAGPGSHRVGWGSF